MNNRIIGWKASASREIAALRSPSGRFMAATMLSGLRACTELSSALCALGDHDINIASCHAVITKLAIVHNTR